MKYSLRSAVALLLCIVMLSSVVLTSCVGSGSNGEATDGDKGNKEQDVIEVETLSPNTDTQAPSSNKEETASGADPAPVIEATGVKLNQNSLSLIKGESKTLKGSVAPIETTDKTLTWSTSDSKVATVNNGTVKAVGAGSATITATTANGKTDTCNVTVNVLASSVKLNRSAISLIKGESETLTANILPADTVDKTLTWSTSDATVATVDNGRVTAKGAGDAVITVTTANGKSATCSVSVSVLAASVSLDRTSIRINAGETTSLTATVTPADTTNKTLMWSTNNSSVVTVQNGVLTAIRAGSARITVRTANGSRATCDVTVIENGISFKNFNTSLKEISYSVSNATESFSLKNEITATGNATFKIYSDSACANVIDDETLSLSVGDNVFYVLEYVGSGENATANDLYTVTIRRKPTYTVTFDANGGTPVASQVIEEGGYITSPRTSKEGYTFSCWQSSQGFDIGDAVYEDIHFSAEWGVIAYTVTYNLNGGSGATKRTVRCDQSYTLSTPTRVGYDFDGWYYNGVKMDMSGIWTIASNVTLDAKWNPKTNIQYVVRHEKEDIDGSWYLDDEEDLTGTSDAEITPAVRYYEGFTSPKAQKTKISPDGSLEVVYRYTRNSYNITFVTNDGGVASLGTLKYGEDLPDLKTLNPDFRYGFTFGGWYSDVKLSNKVTVMLAYDMTVYAYWEEEAKPSDFEYVRASAITITKYIGSRESVNIPAYIGGKAVTAIGDNAFKGCGSILGIAMPESITSIGISAFEGCSKLSGITVGENVKSIGAYAFKDCVAFVSVVIPNGVMKIGEGAFSGCGKLQSITLPFVGDSVKTEKDTYQYPLGYIFGTQSYANAIATSQDYYGSSTELITSTTYYIPKTLKSVRINGGNILCGAFSNCITLTYISLPSDITDVGDYAFYCCYNLSSISIPSTVTDIGAYAFYNCYNFSSISIPSAVKSIGDYAFYYCDNISSISIPKNVESIGKYAFASCYHLSSVTINDGVKSIGAYAFKSCKNIISITVPNSVESIGEGAFSGCYNLQSITLPFVGGSAKTENDTYQYPLGYIFGTQSYTDGVATEQYYYGNSTSYTANTTYYIPSDLRRVVITSGNILYGAFYGCSTLTSVTLPTNAEKIGSLAFYGCFGLEAINVPNSVKSIGEGAFENCSLLSISLPFVGESASATGYRSHFGYIFGYIITSSNSVYHYYDSETRRYYYYYIPTYLSDVSVNAAESIGEQAFRNCSSLTSVDISSTVTSIGEGAFSGCSGLNEITLPFVGGSVKTENDTYQYPFGYIFGTQSYTGGVETEQHYYGSSTETGTQTSTTYCIPQTLKSVRINGGNILFGAFYGCSMLKYIYVDSNVTNIGQYAFAYCSGLLDISLPSSIESVEYSAFNNCNELLLNEHGNAKYLGNDSDPYVILIKALNTSIGSCEIYSGTKVIYQSAFSGCRYLTSISVPSSVRYIGDKAFTGCKGLQSITLPFVGASVKTEKDTEQYPLGYIFGTTNYSGSVAVAQTYYGSSITETTTKEYRIPYALRRVTVTGGNILYGAFSGCNMLTEIVLDSGVKSISEGALTGCSGLTHITLPFVGGSAKTENDTYQYPLGYIFGTQSYTGGVATEQYYYGNSTSYTANTTYYIPSSLRGVEIISGNIPYGAFYGCSTLTSVTLPTNAGNIGSLAFYGCIGLKSVNVPSSVTSIGEGAFSGCKSLTSITLPFVGGTEASGEVFGYVFGKEIYEGGTICNTYCIPSGLKTVSVRRGSIPNYAFMGCSGLTRITLTNSTNSIGNSAFYGCSSLVSVSGSYIYNIGDNAFYGCSKLASFNFSSYLNRIGAKAFYGCASLTSVSLRLDFDSVGEDAFFGCTGITEVFTDDLESWCYIDFANGYSNPLAYAEQFYVAGEPVNEITISDVCNDFVFYGAKMITSVTIQNYPNEIGEAAFYGCVGLKSVTMQNISTIGDSAFYGCSGLESVILPSDLEYIEDNAFAGCSLLSSLTIPSSVYSIGNNAFLGCTGISRLFISSLENWCTNISFENGYANPMAYAKELYIGDGAEAVTEMILSDVFHINAFAFYGLRSIKSVVIYGEINSIGESAFAGCSGLTEIELPEGLMYIREYAFSNCGGLKSIIIPSTVRSIGDYAFSGCNRLAKVTVQRGTLQEIGSYAFASCSLLKSIILPSSLNSIGEYAFNECESLTDVYYYGNNSSWELISIDSDGNEALTLATVYYYSASYPSDNTNKYWYITNGTVKQW